MKKKPIVVFCTTPDLESANKIAHQLVSEKQAACCNIMPGITSVYTWQGKVEHADEHLLLIKTSSDNFESLQDAIIRLHPYAVPEIISVDITSGSKDYLAWISENVR